MIDVKKLIIGFLILAGAATFSGLIFSLVSNQAPSAAAAPQPTIGDDTSSSTLTNAFLPTEAPSAAALAAMANPASSTLVQSSTDPSNLTDVLATAFVNEVVAENPDGPTTQSDTGEPTIASPSIDAVASDLSNTSATANLQIPDWDVEAASIPIKTVATSSSAAITQYGNAVNGVLSEHLNDQAQNILSTESAGANASDLAYVESQIQSALQDTAALQTPTQVVPFQKALIKALVYDKNMLALMDTAQTDPVKATLIFQDEDSKFSSVQQDLQTQAQTIATEDVSLGPPPAQHPNMIVSFVDHTFGIPTAQALFPVFDPATWSLIEANEGQTIANQLEVVLKNTLLQILKNTLIALIQQKVLAWVNGSGAPRFITSWGDTLINSYETSAINSINSAMSCGVYPAFIPQIKVALGSFYKPGGTNACANQFAAALGANSFQQFYGNFANGGFIALGASTLPSGNPYGGVFFNAQIVEQTAQNTQNATLAKNSVAGGFKGDQVCDDSSNPNSGEHTVCENPDGPDYTIQGTEQCGPGDTPVVYANAGTCSDGTEPVVTTPGTVTGFALNSAVDATPKQIAAANDIVGLLNAVLGSLLNSLASAAVTAAGNAVNQGLAALPTPTTGGTPALPQTALSCTPATQIVPVAAATTGVGPTGTATTSTPSSLYPTSFSAIGGTTNANGVLPTYTWTSSDGTTGTGSSFSAIFSNPGTYTVTVSDSSNDAPSTCSVTVQ